MTPFSGPDNDGEAFNRSWCWDPNFGDRRLEKKTKTSPGSKNLVRGDHPNEMKRRSENAGANENLSGV